MPNVTVGGRSLEIKGQRIRSRLPPGIMRVEQARRDLQRSADRAREEEPQRPDVHRAGESGEALGAFVRRRAGDEDLRRLSGPFQGRVGPLEDVLRAQAHGAVGASC